MKSRAAPSRWAGCLSRGGQGGGREGGSGSTRFRPVAGYCCRTCTHSGTSPQLWCSNVGTGRRTCKLVVIYH